MGKIAMELFHDNFQNFKRYNIPRAQLVIADIPYNIGENAYGSNPMWYQRGGQQERRKQACKKCLLQRRRRFQNSRVYALLQ